MFLLNVVSNLPDYTVSYARKPYYDISIASPIASSLHNRMKASANSFGIVAGYWHDPTEGKDFESL
jgi:hypothetical protein